MIVFDIIIIIVFLILMILLSLEIRRKKQTPHPTLPLNGVKHKPIFKKLHFKKECTLESGVKMMYLGSR